MAAIRDKTGFVLDAEIRIGADARMIRIVAHLETIDGRAARLFGSKSDVSHEYAAWQSAGRRIIVTVQISIACVRHTWNIYRTKWRNSTFSKNL